MWSQGWWIQTGACRSAIGCYLLGDTVNLIGTSKKIANHERKGQSVPRALFVKQGHVQRSFSSVAIF